MKVGDRSKTKGLSLIEVALVVVVIALILLVAANQVKRYQFNRGIQVAKMSVSSLQTYAHGLFLSQCRSIFYYDIQNPSQPTTIYTLNCPNASPSQNLKCFPSGTPLVVTNPFVPASATHQYTITLLGPANSESDNTALLVIGIPISAQTLKITSLTLASLAPLIGVLKPSQIAFKNVNHYSIIGAPNDTSHSFSNDYCLNYTGQDACLEWVLTPDNDGNLAALSGGNFTLNANILSFAGEYYPQRNDTYDQKGIQKSDFGSDKLGCVGAIQAYYRCLKNPSACAVGNQGS